MKRGDKVWVCQDGKFSRRVEGTITKTRQGHHACVQFIYQDAYGNDSATSFWARLTCRGYGYGVFAGWSDTGRWCDWYTVMKQSDGQCREDERIVAESLLEEAFADFNKRGSNGKHKWGPRRFNLPGITMNYQASFSGTKK